MDIIIQNTKKDFLKSFKPLVLRKVFSSKLYILGLLFLIICIFNTTRVFKSQFTTYQFVFIALAIILGTLLLLYFIFFIAFYFRLDRIFKLNPIFLEKHTITLDQNGINSAYNSKRTTLNWVEISALLKTKDLIIIQSKNGSNRIIPLRFFSATQETEIFFNSIKVRSGIS